MTIGDKYHVEVPMEGYISSQDALNRENSNSTVGAGDYYIYNEVEGALALSTSPTKNTGGGWINILQNEENMELNYTTDDVFDPADPSNTDTVYGYFSETQGSDLGNYETDATTMAMPPGTTCYIMNLVTGSRIQFHIPQQVSDSVSGNFDPIDIRGRSNSLQGFNTTGPRTISFDFEVHRDFCPHGFVEEISKIKALTYPGYVGYIDPPKVYVRLGNAVRGTFVVNDVGITYNIPYVEDMYVYAEVSISLTEAGDEVYSAAQIEDGYGMTK